MSKISAIDFANNVENNRQRLIQHCLENGVQASTTDSLDSVVIKNNTIEQEYSGYNKVEFRDIDGSVLAPTQYIQAGGAVDMTGITANYDPDYLEFDEWRYNGDITNVQSDMIIAPLYKTKVDTTTGYRPTYLFCYFDSSTLNPTFIFSSYSTSRYVNAYIDFGDGNVQKITSGNISHTYAQQGYYVVKIYGDAIEYIGGGNYGLFSSTSYGNCLIKMYIGGNNNYIPQPSGLNGSSRSLRVISLAKSSTTTSGSTPFFAVAKFSAIKILVIPKEVTTNNFPNCTNCYNLEYVIVQENASNMTNGSFNNCYNLKWCPAFDKITAFSTSTSTSSTNNFSSCRSLTKFNLNPGVGNLSTGCFNGAAIKTIVIPESVNNLYQTTFSNSDLESVVILNPLITMSNDSNYGSFRNCYLLKNVTLAQDTTVNLAFSYCYSISKESLIDIANKIKDVTGQTNLTITLPSYLQRTMQITYLDEYGQEVPAGTTGAVSILEFIQNKNWTVAFA